MMTCHWQGDYGVTSDDMFIRWMNDNDMTVVDLYI